MRTPLNVSQVMDGSLVIGSNRDQMEVSLSSVKIDVRDVSGRADRISTSVPQALQSVFSKLSPTGVRSYGINFILESDIDGEERADIWVGQHFLSESLAEDIGPGFSSDSIALSFTRGLKTHTIRLNVVGNNKIVINTNVSVQTVVLPGSDALATEMDEQYCSLMELLKKIGFK